MLKSGSNGFFPFLVVSLCFLKRTPSENRVFCCTCLVQTADSAAHPGTDALSIGQGDRLVWGTQTSKSTAKSRCRALNRSAGLCWAALAADFALGRWWVQGQLLGIFTQSAKPAGNPFPLVVPVRFLRIKQKYRALHPVGNKQANVQYYSVKNKLSLTFLDAFAYHSIVYWL